MRTQYVVVACGLAAGGCRFIVGITDVTVDGSADSVAPPADAGWGEDASVPSDAGARRDADASAPPVDAAPDAPPTGWCAPGQTRSCGVTGTQTCSPLGGWCGCLDDYGNGQTCSGADGGWQACNGTGCAVCTDTLNSAVYPCYFDNHPECVPTGPCNGTVGACNAKCPAPTTEDKCIYSSSAQGWAQSCALQGNYVCSDAVDAQLYSCYFINHPGCHAQNCALLQKVSCALACPAPTSVDIGADGGA